MSETKARKTPLYSDIGPFFMVPLWLVLATDNAHAIRVFAYLGAKHADRDTGEAFPSHRTIALALNISTATVERALQELKRVKAVEIETRKLPTGQTSNIYRLRTSIPVDPTSPVMTGGSSPAMTGGSSRKRRAVITREAPEPESLNQKDATRPVTNQSHNEPEPVPETMDRPLDETEPSTYLAPSVDHVAKTSFATADSTPRPGYHDGNLRRPNSPEGKRERALKDARQRREAAERTFDSAKSRHDIAVINTGKTEHQAARDPSVIAVGLLLAEADSAYRTAAQAVRELEREPDTPVPRDASTTRPAFVNRAVTRLGG